jgi:putative hydrolase of the HAD superfamily
VRAPAPVAPRRAVLFDLYGTLIDIRTDEGDPGVWWALAQYLGYLGVVIGADELRAQYQARVEFQLRSSPQAHPEVDVFAVFRDVFAAYGRAKVSREKIVTAAMLFRSLSRRQFGLFPDAAAVLRRLRERHAIALVSDAQWVFTEPELEMTGLRDLFDARVLSSRLGFKKPDPRLFAKALGALHVAPADAVYVGDNPARDLVGARRAGLRCVLFRPSSNGSGERPDAVIGRHADLEETVERLFAAGRPGGPA